MNWRETVAAAHFTHPCTGNHLLHPLFITENTKITSMNNLSASQGYLALDLSSRCVNVKSFAVGGDCASFVKTLITDLLKTRVIQLINWRVSSVLCVEANLKTTAYSICKLRWTDVHHFFCANVSGILN